MNQQINLYSGNSSNAKATFYLSVVLLALFIACAVAFSFYLKNDVNTLRANVTQQQQLLANAEAHTAKMKIKHPKKKHNPLLEKRVKQSQTLRQNLLDVMTLISDTSSDITQGFSRYLTAFAQQKTAGIWIKQLIVNAEKSDITLIGGTNNAENVPVFLQNLHNEPIFNGKVFSNLKMDTDPDSGILLFEINTLLSNGVDDEINATTTTAVVNKRTAAMSAKIKGTQE